MNLVSPPRVISQGRATHGVRGLVDVFRLPDLWSLHLYGYAGELEVDGTAYAIMPGSISLVPPDSLIRSSTRVRRPICTRTFARSQRSHRREQTLRRQAGRCT